MTDGLLVVRSEAQRVLFAEELAGQISDGMWENLNVRDHWQAWCGAKVVVAKPHQNPGRTFWARYDKYNFTNKDLLDVVGDRMLASVQALPGHRFYTWANMVEDLRDLKAIVKQRTEPTPGQREQLLADERAHQAVVAAHTAARVAEVAEVNRLAEACGLRLRAYDHKTQVEVSRGELLLLLAEYEQATRTAAV